MTLRQLYLMAQARLDVSWEQAGWVAYHVHAWSMAKNKLPHWKFNPRSKPSVPGTRITRHNFDKVMGMFGGDGSNTVVQSPARMTVNEEE